MEVKPQMVKATVTRKTQLNSKVIQVTLSITSPASFQFIPGQYGTVIIDTATRRQYSFASAPQELPACSFVIDTTPQGPGSKYFKKLGIGDEIHILAPLGTFTIKESPRKKIMVATGTGIAPFRSVIQNELSAVSSQLSIGLYWGLRFEEDIYWKEEFDAIAGQHTGFQFFLCLSKPTAQWQGLIGHVTEHVLKNEKNPSNCDFYLCGNRGMISQIEERLIEAKVPKEQVLSDIYF